MKRKEGGRGGEKMSRQCPLCIGWVSPRAFVMLYTDPLSKVAVRLPVQLFSYSVSASFLSLLCDFFFFFFGRGGFLSVTVGQIITRGQQITHRKRQQKRQNKWKAAKILILIRMGEVGKNSCKCTAIQASLIETHKKAGKEVLLRHRASNDSDLCCDQSLMEKVLSTVATGGGGEASGGNVAWTDGLRGRAGQYG